MNTIGKILIAVAFVVETLTVSAQISSLPIGSTNAVLQDALRHLTGVGWSIELLSKDGLYIEQFLAKKTVWTAESVAHLPRFPKEVIWNWNYERDGDPTDFMKQKLTEDIRAINWNKPEYEGRMFQTKYTGRKDFDTMWYLIFGDINEFTLVRNEKGELAPPPVAYQIDLVAALMRGHGHGFFVENIERAVLEVEDGSGKVVIRQDSQERGDDPYRTEYYPEYRGGIGVGWITVIPKDGVLGLPKPIFATGERGRVFIWYTSGIKQIFSLADGRLVPSLSLRKANSGVELVVSSPDAFTIEASDDLRKWYLPYLPPVIQPASQTFLHRFLDPASAEKRFYRLRIESAAAQNRR